MPLAVYFVLFTAPARFAVSAAFFNGFTRSRKHLPAITAFGFGSAIGAKYFGCVAFYKLFKRFSAIFANIL